MNLDREKYPVLEFLRTEEMKLYFLPQDKADAQALLAAGLEEELLSGVEAFRSQVLYPSKPFLNAALSAGPSLSKFCSDRMTALDPALEIAGTVIYSGWVVMVDCYLLPDKSAFGLRYFVFHPLGIPAVCSIEVPDREPINWVSYGYNQGFKDRPEVEKTKFITNLVIDVLIILLFKRFAQVEVLTVPPRAKVKHGAVKARNDTGIPVLYLDSKWFTTLVRSEGFKVSGHFRLQPKKVNGEWTRELIWINEFEKHGYTSKARKLRPENIEQ